MHRPAISPRLLGVATVLLLLLAVVPSGRSAQGQIVPAPLLQKAWSQGEVDVIVRLSATWAPEASLPSAAHVASQQQDIRALATAVKSALRGFHHRVKREYDALPFLALAVDAHALQVLGALPGIVAEVVEDELSRLELVESVPIAYQSGPAWPGVDGTGTVVAVLDSGVDPAHPFVGGKVIAEACFSTTNAIATNVCPGGVDSTAPGSGADCSVNGCEHGTHVTGIVAGGTTGVGGSGVAPGARIWSIQVSSAIDDWAFCGGAPPCAGTFTSDQIAALNHVYKNRTMAALGGRSVAAVNMSIGGGAFASACDGDARKPAIDNLRAVKVATVVAAGNSGLKNAISAPACVSTAIAVASTDDGSSGTTLDAISWFSNIGPHTNLLLAPGQWITSSVPGGGFDTFAGTSMAAPHVAGAFAALREQEPGATVGALFAALRDGGSPITDTRAGGLHTKPRIGIGNALSAFGDIQFQSASFSAAEGDGTATITVVRQLTGVPATVRYATSDGTAIAGTHYKATSGTLLFSAGEASKTFTVGLIDNTRLNAPRTVKLKLSSPTGAVLGSPATATLTIDDDDNGGTIAFDSAAYSVAENAGTATITLVRTGTNLASGVTVGFSTANLTATAPADYTAKTGTVTFAAGQTSKTFSVAVVDDALLQGDRTFEVSLDSAGGGGVLGAPTAAVVTIVENDTAGTIQFAKATYSVGEGSASATIRVTRAGTSLAKGVTVNYAATAGTATAGSDFKAVTGTLTFGAGATRASFAVPILHNASMEPVETVNLALTLPGGSLATLGSPSSAQLGIIDAEAPLIQFAVAAQSVAEGRTVTVAVTRARQLGLAVTADYQVIGGTATGPDYAVLGTGTVSFGAGVTSQTFQIQTADDALVEGPETIVLALQNPSAPAILGARSQTTLTITDNDSAGVIQFGQAAYSVAENTASGGFDVTVTRAGTGLVGGITVDYAVTGGTATAGVDYTLAAGQLTFAAGQTSAVIPVAILDDGLLEGNETVVAALGNPSGGATLGTRSATTLAIVDNEIGLRFSRASYAIGEGGTSAVITVQRVGPRNVPVGVQYATSDGSATAGLDYAARSGTLKIPAGVASATFAVPIREDRLAEGPETVTLTLSNPTGAGALLASPGVATLTVNDNDNGGVIAFAKATADVTEGKSITLTVNRTGTRLASSVTVDYAVTGGTATDGADYTLAAGTLTFGADQTKKTIVVPAFEDGVTEGDETFVVTLGNAGGGGTLSTPASTTVTIRDAAQVGFLNDVCNPPFPGCPAFVARLSTAQGHVWDSFSGVPAPYQPVPEKKLTNIVVKALGLGLSGTCDCTIPITPSQRYLFVLRLYGSAVALVVINEGPLGAPVLAGGDAARPAALLQREPLPGLLLPGLGFERLRAP